jgi:hypothetical protein
MMQGSLLIMCIFWKYRQRRLGIDDFGNPLDLELDREAELPCSVIPGLVGEENPATVSVALADALESAAETDVRSEGVLEVGDEAVSEATPLLGSDSRDSKITERNVGVGWLSWFKHNIT